MPDETEIPPPAPAPTIIVTRPTVADGDWDHHGPGMPYETSTLVGPLPVPQPVPPEIPPPPSLPVGADPPGALSITTTGDIGGAFAHLGQQVLDQLKSDLLAGLSDPEAQALAARASATLASVTLALIGATGVQRADLQNQFDAAAAVIASLASAAGENAAASAARAQAHVREVVAGVVTVGVQAAFDALKVGLKLALA